MSGAGNGILQRAAERKKTASGILADLRLIEKWKRHGRPVIVGAFSYDLVVEPDIDMEIYCPVLEMEHGFGILSECARNPAVTNAQFYNGFTGPDQAYYWQLKYRTAEGVEWKIDMWSAPEDYALPRSEHFVEPMCKVLTDETRRAILELKEARMADSSIACLSIDLYRAVLEGGVRTPDALRDWLATHPKGQLTDWKP